jgi:phage shock protein PspC (stress-responsive transcriptional regulator)
MIHDEMARQGLVRPEQGRVFAGVCAGLGRRFGLDPWAARLLFVIVLMVLPGSQLLVYPVLWILMPSERTLWAPQPWQAQQGQAPYQPAQGRPPVPPVA